MVDQSSSRTVFIDLDGRGGEIQAVAAAVLATGNPILLSRRLVDVVGFKSAANDPPENVIAIEDGSAGAVEGDPPDASGTGERAGLALDIDDARFHGAMRIRAACSTSLRAAGEVLLIPT